VIGVATGEGDAVKRGRAGREGGPLPVWVRAALGGLWLLDALLQAQPGMFTMAMLNGVMQPGAQGQPAWLAGAMTWAIRLITPHVPWWNAGFIAVQAAIAAGLLVPRARWNRAALWLSLAWSACVWVFGEGLGQLLTGSATVVTGAPGSVALYGAVAGLLLAGWGRGGRVDLPHARALAAGLFAAGAALQAAGPFWTPLGLASLFEGVAMMQPRWFVDSLAPVVAASHAQPVLMNGLFIATMAAAAWGLARRAAWGYAVAAAWLLFTWWFGQGLGMLLTGMGTDPGTAPLLALLLVAAAREEADLARCPRTAAA
jgi:hypothetical protein